MPPNDPDNLSAIVRQLIQGPVDSFEKLEVLVALQGAGGTLTFAQLAAQSRLTPEQVEPATAGLTAAGLLEQVAPDAWRIPAARRGAIDEFAAAWTNARASVLRAMTDRALDRIRTSAARAFADAFRLRRRDKDGEDDDG